MIISKENVVVYTIQIDTEIVNKAVSNVNDIPDLFKKEFERAGLTKEANRMDKGGFSYRMSERNSYFVEYKVSITTRRKFF